MRRPWNDPRICDATRVNNKRATDFADSVDITLRVLAWLRDNPEATVSDLCTSFRIEPWAANWILRAGVREGFAEEVCDV